MSTRQELLGQLRTNLYQIRGDGTNTELNKFIDWCCRVATGATKESNDEIDYRCYHISITAVNEESAYRMDIINRIIKELVQY